MSYRTDQWFRFRGGTNLTGENFTSNPTKTGSGYAVPGSGNDDFIYPARAVRGIDKRGNHTSTYLKRGYIRSLLTGDGLDIKKCQFQFNPATINQSVTQNTSILNFLQIDPYQYSQPLPGNVTFQFDLFFDRSMEVANGGGNSSVSEDPWARLGPDQVGVLHDLSSLYSIIGVGVSEYMENRALNAAQEYIGTAIDTLVDRKTTEITSDDTVGLDADQERADYRQAATDFLGLNRGNTAFLLPLPVRVVFSSLYIVEGLVQDFNVLFTKFSTNMVPMQCSVTVTFEAKYIGFAKKDTFFTDVLDKARAEAGSKQYDQISDAYAGYLDSIIDDLTTVRMMVTEDDEKADKEQDYSGSTAISQFISQDTGYFSRDSNIENLDKYVKILFNDRGKLYNLLTQGTSVSIAVSGKVEAWRFTKDFRRVYSSLFNSAGRYQELLNAGVSENSVNSDANRAAEAGSSIVRALDSWISRAGDPSTRLPDEVYQNLFPAQNNGVDRVFNTVVKLWEVQIGDANRGDEAVVNASTSDEWLEMKTKFCYSNNQTFGNADRNLDDGVNTPNEDSMAYNESEVFWAVRFTLQLVVNINGESATRETTAYIIRNQNGDFNVDTSLEFDWESLRDDIIETTSEAAGQNISATGA